MEVKFKMDTKILIGILLLIGIIGVGIAVAHGNNKNSDDSGMSDMAEMMEEMMNGNDSGNMMGMMMGNMEQMHEETSESKDSDGAQKSMISDMEEIMDDEEFREEMLEHTESCPMMKRLNS